MPQDSQYLKSGLLAFIAMLFFSGCFSNPAPPSALNLYGIDPVKQDVSGSRGYGVAERTFSFTFDEVFDAVQKAILRKGLNAEKIDAKKGTIIGSGWYEQICGAGPCLMSTTFAIQVKEVSSDPRTKVILRLDRHGFMAWGGEQGVADKFIIEIQKVLATF